MKEKPPDDELLWRLTEAGMDSDEATLGDETLRAYRSGALTADEADAVEAVLARSARARTRLHEIAGIATALPPVRVRRRLFDETSARARGPLRMAAWVAAAAATIAIVTVGYRFATRSSAVTLPAGLRFDLRVEGLAQVRGNEDRLPRALPDTTVRIFLEPQDRAVSGLAYGLYRKLPGELRRVMPGTELDVRETRGAVTFTARAAMIVGSSPGEREIFVVVAPGGPLPASVSLDPLQVEAAALEQATRGLVYRSVLTILDPEAIH